MRWKHNIVPPTRGYAFVGRHISKSQEGFYLWLNEQRGSKSWRLPFTATGQPLPMKLLADHCFDTVLTYSRGSVMIRYESPVAKVTCYSTAGMPIWEGNLKDADSRYWDIAASKDENLLMAYSSRNLYDAFQQAHVVKIDTSQKNREPALLFTIPEQDYSCVQVLVPIAERYAVCARNLGAGVIFHILDDEGNSMLNGSFAAHPHSRWAVPRTHVPLANSENLLGGWQETVPGLRLPWVGRFDANMDVIYGETLPVANGETMVTQLSKADDGHIFALCPPWTIFRMSLRGFPTHVWEVPNHLKANTLTGAYGLDEGACLITGSSYTEDKSEAVWLAEIEAGEFAAL